MSVQGAGGQQGSALDQSAVKPRADAGTEPLSPDDVSHAKLVELQVRLLAATLAETLLWEKWPGGEFVWSSPKGVVNVGRGWLSVWDDSGILLRRFRPDSDDLYRAAAGWHDAMVCAALAKILADLDAVESASQKDNPDG